MKKKLCLAYFTVEASLLIPFLFAVNLIFIYMFIFIYDCTLLSQETYYTCEKVRECLWEDNDPVNEAERVLGQIKKESPFLSCNNLSMYYSKTGYKVTIDAETNIKIPVKNYINNWFNVSNMSIESSKYAYITKPQSIMRMTYSFGD